jgi:diguanylate cyclase (GGDEF)-like protein
MWIVHKVSKGQIYWAAAKESLNVWLLLTILSIVGVLGQRLVGLLRQLGQQTYHDVLTGLPNRRLLEDRLDQEVIRATREQRRISLLFIDLDKFKPVNDRYGHAVGDWLLKQVAERMRASLRQSDTAARIGGDEFVVLLPDVKNSEAAITVAEKIRKALLLPFVRDDGTELNISSSIGVAFFPDHADGASELLRFGDEAMYLAKESGRNTVVVFSPGADNGPASVAQDSFAERVENGVLREGLSTPRR